MRLGKPRIGNEIHQSERARGTGRLSGSNVQVDKTEAVQHQTSALVMFDDDNDDQDINNNNEITVADIQPPELLDERPRVTYEPTKTDESTLANAGSINEIEVGPTTKRRYKYKDEYTILEDGDLWAVE